MALSCSCPSRSPVISASSMSSGSTSGWCSNCLNRISRLTGSVQSESSSKRTSLSKEKYVNMKVSANRF